MDSRNQIKRYLLYDGSPRNFWESLVYLESRGIWTRYLVYLALTFIVYVAPAFVAYVIGAYTGGDVSGMVLPLHTLLPGVESSALQLFIHNSIIATVIFAGFLSLGIITILVLMLNAMFIGYGAGYMVGVYGFIPASVAVFTHGVFELSALWLAGALSVRVVHILSMFSPSARSSLKNTSPSEFMLTKEKLFEVAGGLILMYGLLAIAAIIEVYVTPLLVMYVS